MEIKSSLLFTTFLLVGLASELHAQSSETSISPNRTGFIDPAAFGVGPPGFVMDSTFMDTQDFSDIPGGLDFFELRTIAPIGAKKFGDLLVAGSIGYTLTNLDFNGFTGLGNESLHTLEAQIQMFWRPEGSPWSVFGFVTPGIGTDFQSLSGDDFEVSGLGLVNYRFSDTFSLAGGLFGQYGAVESMIGPALGFIWLPRPFIVQLTPPFAVIGWNATDHLTLSFSAYPSGGSWDIEDPNVNRVDITGWQTAASVRYQLTENISFSVRAGLNIGGELELRDANENLISNQDLDPALFGAINIRYNF